nr:phospholipase-like, aminotransferase-like mobile domain protein [Tanacetum cinerariifolium]
MLQKQKVSDNDHYDLPLIYNVNGHTLHFGRREFCLITGFKFGFNSFRKFREGDISFRNRVCLEKIAKYVKSIELLSVIEDEERFTGLSDEDSIRVCLLLSLEVIFMGHELGYVVDDVFLMVVDNLEAWNVFLGVNTSGGSYILPSVVNSKHKDAHHKALEINPNFVSSYSLSGFVLCFKWYTPRAPPVEYDGLFGDYLKKLSSARTLREKDKEVWFGTKSSSKEVSLHTRVKDLEGLCNSLMILPKEIKSLKARVYKLETIINVITSNTKATNVKHKVNTPGTKDKVESVGKQCDLGDKCWSDQDGNILHILGRQIEHPTRMLSMIW